MRQYTPTAGLGTVLDSQTVIDTLNELNLGFWETVFGDGQSQNMKLEEATSKLDAVQSIVKLSE